MKRRNPLTIPATTLLGALALAGPSSLQAQEGPAAGVGAARSRNERVVTEKAVPPTANSVARDAAEGKLAPVPPQLAPGVGAGVGTGAVDPAARALLPPGGLRRDQMDPAVRLQPAVVGPAGVRGLGMYPPGSDITMLIEHALGMAIEGSALQSIAQQGTSIQDPADPSRMLMDHARQELQGSKALLTQAAGDGRDVSAASPARRFYSAANNYVTTLGSMANASVPMSPADRAQVAMINHSVKSVLDADHIRQMGRGMGGGSVALEQLLAHAQMMRENGSQNVARFAGNGPALDPATAPSPALLAQRGRELLDAAEQLGAANAAAGPALMAPPAGRLFPGAGAATIPQPGANVGALRDTRPEIIGGTQGTGSPTNGTATGAEAGANVRGGSIPSSGRNDSPVPNGPRTAPGGTTGSANPR